MTYMFIIDYQSFIAHSFVGTHMLLHAPIASPVTLHTTMAPVEGRKEIKILSLIDKLKLRDCATVDFTKSL